MHPPPYLILEREETHFADDPQHAVRWAVVVCPYGEGSGTLPSHPRAEILVTSAPHFRRGTVAVWHVDVLRHPSEDPTGDPGKTFPGRLRIAPSIGLHLVERHLPECHLGTGELDFYWRVPLK
ncbi:MAG TPA: hypothetical protein VMG99_09085 [Thermoplasmata archaeon]|nr:hypothetical protein [Thermoplasmata archaeon]